MTFNGAFPSSPLSRSALQDEHRVLGNDDSSGRFPPLSPSSSFQERRATAGPSNLSKSRFIAASRRASEGVPTPATLLRTAKHLQFPPLSSSAISTSPPRTPPLNQTVDTLSTLSTPSSTSPHTFFQRSPKQRSNSSSASRRRFSEQSHSPGPNFGSFVGSYEESLLSGRMSSLPSKPLIFDAELGVLGLGKCKASLRCPPHVNFTFPAHFYNLQGESEKDGSASLGTPYVGTIDVEGHYLDALLTSRMDGLAIPRHIAGLGSDIDGLSQSVSIKDCNTLEALSFPGYQIPPKGQIQLVIKNPHLTAVKLFLVPYDFTDMPVGTKTFIRQKSHVICPGTESVTTSPSPGFQGRRSVGRDTLKYAVHLQFCSLSSTRSSRSRPSEPGFTTRGLDRLHYGGRSEDPSQKTRKQKTLIYLHKNIRVVFGARVPDSTEKLRIVTETPGGAQGNLENVYLTYNGPSEDWKEAKRYKRANQMQIDRQLGHVESGRIDRRPVGVAGSGEDDNANIFRSGVINSDPNGERWFEDRATNGDPSMSNRDDVVDDLASSPSPWHEHKEPGQARQLPIPPPSPVSASSVPLSAAFTDGKPASLQSMKSKQLAPSLSETATYLDQDEDRALLEQWHASLALRPQSIGPISTTSARNRPASPPSARRPVTPTNGFFTSRNRSGSSTGGGGDCSGNLGKYGDFNTLRSPSRASSTARRRNQPVSPQRTGDDDAFVDAIPGTSSLARPIHAVFEFDQDPNGKKKEQQPQRTSTDSSFSTPRRSSLIRQWSSQSQLDSGRE
ncbi:hypothetical protein CBS101457_000607 [Exobasidium rhododendri]|nr:hypothetical protein CBS101457_000607 [Exobasidium rhododendri]